MQRKNTKLIFKQKQDYWGLLFVDEGSNRECSKSSVFINSISWNCVQYIFISRGAVFPMRWEYLKQDSNNILKQFLYFYTINFWKKKS